MPGTAPKIEIMRQRYDRRRAVRNANDAALDCVTDAPRPLAQKIDPETRGDVEFDRGWFRARVRYGNRRIKGSIRRVYVGKYRTETEARAAIKAYRRGGG